MIRRQSSAADFAEPSYVNPLAKSLGEDGAPLFTPSNRAKALQRKNKSSVLDSNDGEYTSENALGSASGDILDSDDSADNATHFKEVDQGYDISFQTKYGYERKSELRRQLVEHHGVNPKRIKIDNKSKINH